MIEELIETRPKYTIAGQLHAIEVYDSEDLWFAHLEITLYLTRFTDGERLWSMDFDQRKQIEAGDYGHAARALSELFSTCMTQALAELSGIGIARGPEWKGPPKGLEPTEDIDPRAPVLVPETPRTREKAPK